MNYSQMRNLNGRIVVHRIWAETGRHAFPNLEAKPQVLQVALGSDPASWSDPLLPAQPRFPVRMFCEKVLHRIPLLAFLLGRRRESQNEASTFTGGDL